MKYQFINSILLFIILSCSISFGQSKTGFHYLLNDFTNAEIIKSRRDKLSKTLDESTLCLTFSSDYYNKADAGNIKRNQSSNFLYLTGLYYEKGVLALFKNPISFNGKMVKEILFLEKQNNKSITWNGPLMTHEYAAINLKFDLVMPLENLKEYLIELAGKCQRIQIIPFTKAQRNPNISTPYEEDIFEIYCIKDEFHRMPIKIDGSEISQLRSVKDSSEIRLIKKAIEISIKSFKATFDKIKSLKYEYQVEGLIDGNFTYFGAENTAYNSIIGSFYNSCFLHYDKNRDEIKPNSLILMDCGAEYHGYASDITRTVPQTGKFSNEQKIIYNIVLEAADSAMNLCKKGVFFSDPNDIAKKIVKKRLIENKILKEDESVEKYFPHGTSHHLGLDVHDVGKITNLESGNIITIEPGVYIPEGSECETKWHGIGVRIEDDILITSDGFELLSKDLPRKAEEIEKLIK